MKAAKPGCPALPKLRFIPALGGVPLELHYDFLSATGVLVMADNNEADMDGCIEVFSRIDPHVGAITTASGVERGAVYLRHGEKWEAQGPGRARRA